MRAFFLAFALTLAACGAPTPANDTAHSAALEVRDVWAAPTPNGVDVSAGYLTIVNGTDADDTLVSATSPRAGRLEIHEMTRDGSVMRMQRVETLVVGAGQTVSLAPGGQHLMFYEVARPFALGERIPVTLTFQNAGEIALELPVQRAAAQGHGEGH